MSEEPLYPKIVIGFEPNERGDDAAALGELLAAAGGGEQRRVHIEHESPPDALYELVERGEADLLALGSTHRASLGRVTPGSVAERLLSGARCRLAIAPRAYARARAVLAAEAAGEEADDVPAGSPFPFVRGELRVIAVGFDGSAESRQALTEAAELAERTGASLRLIGVSEPLPPTLGAAAGAPPIVPQDLQSDLHEAAAGLPSDLRALPVHERGNAVEKLIEKVEEGVDLLVLGSRGFGPVLRLMVGSVSARVIRNAPCPVMVVPRPAG